MEKVATEVLRKVEDNMKDYPSFINAGMEKEADGDDVISIKIKFSENSYIILMPMNKGMYIRKVKNRKIIHDFVSWKDYSFEEIFFKRGWDTSSPIQFG
jgi:hypothetical protein